MALPKFVVIQSNYNNKHLRYIHEDNPAHGYLQFSGMEFVSPYTKFEVEQAGNGLVHIRSCYNNKYWVRSSEASQWIVAESEESEEDHTKWSCTLFKPVPVKEGDFTIVRFLHVQLGKYACLWRTVSPFESCLFASSATPDEVDVFTIFNWESILILPLLVAFRDTTKEKDYICAKSGNPDPYLQFEPSSIENECVWNNVTDHKHDGSVHINSYKLFDYWKRNFDNWIRPNSKVTDNTDTLFLPCKQDNNVVVLVNSGNGKYCRRKPYEDNIESLIADIDDRSKAVHLKLEEPVVSRDIFNVEFCLRDARIYLENSVLLATGYATNNTNEPVNDTVNLEYTWTQSSTWNFTLALDLGVPTNIKTDIPVPNFFLPERIAITESFTGPFKQGVTQKTINNVKSEQNVHVPPMTKVTVTLRATTASYDVPFRYSRCDHLTNNQESISHMGDGLYTGTSAFNFDLKIEPVHL